MSDTASFGYGQQDPNDSASDFNLITFIVRQMMAQLDTMKLVQVKAVHGGGGAIAAAGTVDVLLLVNQLDGNGNATQQGTVYGLPWYRLQGGKNAVICDPLVGDIGFVVCADRDISAVKNSKAQANPGSLRKFDIADGIYVGGILNAVPDQYLAFADGKITLADKNGNSILLNSSGITLTDKSGNTFVMSSSGTALTPASGQPFTVNGNTVVTGNFLLGGTIQAQPGGIYTHSITTSGDVIASGKSLATHTHTQPPDSRGDTEQPTSAPV